MPSPGDRVRHEDTESRARSDEITKFAATAARAEGKMRSQIISGFIKVATSGDTHPAVRIILISVLADAFFASLLFSVFLVLLVHTYLSHGSFSVTPFLWSLAAIFLSLFVVTCLFGRAAIESERLKEKKEQFRKVAKTKLARSKP